MQKSFRQRMAELERLEAIAEAERQAKAGADIPDIDAMSDDEVLWAAILGMRQGNPRPSGYPDWVVQRQHIKLVPYGCVDPRRTAFVVALAHRAQPLIDAAPFPFIPLAGWEVADAIALIDSGRVDVVPSWPAAVEGLRGGHYNLRVDLGYHTEENDEDEDTIAAVNYAVKLWAQQLGYPRVGAWEMTELDQYRAWLAGLLAEATEETV